MEWFHFVAHASSGEGAALGPQRHTFLRVALNEAVVFWAPFTRLSASGKAFLEQPRELVWPNLRHSDTVEEECCSLA
jgi:hypothetical protein